MHLGKMYADHGLFNTFVTERRHKLAKRFSMQLLSRINYEQGLMENLLVQHLHDMDEFNIKLGLWIHTPSSRHCVKVSSVSSLGAL